MSRAIATFFAAWGESDPDLRAGMLRETLSPDIAYLDPRLTDPLIGIDAVNDYIGGYSRQVPGATAAVEAQKKEDRNVLATVAFRMPDGAVQHGQYMIEVATDGRLARMVGIVGLGGSK